MDPVAGRIKELIEALSISNKDFAEEIDVAPAIISHVLSGRNKASLHLIQQITNVYTNVNLTYLLHGSGKLFSDSSSDQESTVSMEMNSLPSGARYVPPPSGAPLKAKSVEVKDEMVAESISKANTEEESKSSRLTNVYTNVNQDKKKKIARIVIFFDDKSFEEYLP